MPPVHILRPTCISAAQQHPAPGWTDSTAAAHGGIMAVATGIARIMADKPRLLLDIIPIDIVVNASIACVAAQSGSNIWNISSSSDNGILLREVMLTASRHFKACPPPKQFRPASLRMVSETQYRLERTAVWGAGLVWTPFLPRSVHMVMDLRNRQLEPMHDITSRHYVFDNRQLTSFYVDRMSASDRKAYPLVFRDPTGTYPHLLSAAVSCHLFRQTDQSLDPDNCRCLSTRVDALELIRSML
jgi:hypothetical protein